MIKTRHYKIKYEEQSYDRVVTFTVTMNVRDGYLCFIGAIEIDNGYSLYSREPTLVYDEDVDSNDIANISSFLTNDVIYYFEQNVINNPVWNINREFTYYSSQQNIERFLR